MAEMMCKVCGNTLVERESREGKKFLACPKSYKGNNHGTYSEHEYFVVEDRAEEGERKYYWLPPTPARTSPPTSRTCRGSSSYTPPVYDGKVYDGEVFGRVYGGKVYQGWIDACNQYREDLGNEAMVTGTEYDLGMSYWEGHY